MSTIDTGIFIPDKQGDGQTKREVDSTPNLESMSSLRAAANITLTFNYFNASGSWGTKTVNVEPCTHVPSFHIHHTINNETKKKVFRYWKLVSGNISSGMEVLSNCTFDAVYDEISTT